MDDPGSAEGTRSETPQISRRLIGAFARGEVTRGGMAEAGWFDIGALGEDGIVFVKAPEARPQQP